MPSAATVSTVITIEGTEYSAEVGTVERVALGYEDHGLFALSVLFNFNGSGQGFGPYPLDDYDDVAKKRGGSARGLDFIIKTTKVLGDLTKAEGRTCYVLRDAGNSRGFIRGLCSIKDPAIHFVPEKDL